MKLKKLFLLVWIAVLCSCTSLPSQDQNNEESSSSGKIAVKQVGFEELAQFVDQEVIIQVRLPHSKGVDSQGKEAALAYDLQSEQFILLDGTIELGGCNAELRGILEYNGYDYVLKLLAYNKI